MTVGIYTHAGTDKSINLPSPQSILSFALRHQNVRKHTYTSGNAGVVLAMAIGGSRTDNLPRKHLFYRFAPRRYGFGAAGASGRGVGGVDNPWGIDEHLRGDRSPFGGSAPTSSERSVPIG
jgi:hypothetical protein